MEDPLREPFEKETGLHSPGDSDYFEVTSFKKVMYEKLIEHPDFRLKWLQVLDGAGQELTLNSYEDAAANPEYTIIGVVGEIPVGAVSIGVSRNSNSHAEVVK